MTDTDKSPKPVRWMSGPEMIATAPSGVRARETFGYLMTRIPDCVHGIERGEIAVIDRAYHVRCTTCDQEIGVTKAAFADYARLGVAVMPGLRVAPRAADVIVEAERNGEYTATAVHGDWNLYLTYESGYENQLLMSKMEMSPLEEGDSRHGINADVLRGVPLDEITRIVHGIIFGTD